MLTLEIIRAAQNNDLAAVTAVVEATDSRVSALAEKAARRIAPNGGDRYSDYREEFAQAGRVVVWESLPRFDGDSVDAYFAWMWTTVERSLLDSVRHERNSGADDDALKVFASMLEKAGGDVYLAEKLAQTVPPKGRRLGADRAHAARLAWQGTESIDAPAPGDETSAAIGESIASVYGVPEDLLDAEDLNREDSRVKHALVHGILDVMGEAQSLVLRHSFGIGDTPSTRSLCFGHGDSGDDEGLAAYLGSDVKRVRDARTKGYKAFAKRFVKAVAATDPERAAELSEAAAVCLSAGGRK